MKLHRKIDTFYKDSKGGVHYLCSTQQHKTCKSATESVRTKCNLKTYERRVGEVLVPARIYSDFAD